MLSIITVNLNNKSGLLKTKATVELLACSVISLELEWLIVDGGSCDGSLDVAYSDSVSTKLVVGLDTGIYNAMNIAIRHTAGDFLLFLNSGDYLIGDFSEFASLRSGLLFPSITESKWLLRRDWMPIWLSMPACHQSIVFPANKAIEYDESFCLCADYKFFLEHSFAGAVFNRSYSLSSVVQDNGISRKLLLKPFLESWAIRRQFFTQTYLFIGDAVYLSSFVSRIFRSCCTRLLTCRLDLSSYRVFKSVTDRTFALLSLVMLLPLLLLVALLVNWQLGAPLLFRQQRPGYRGKPFGLLKFRTMTNHRDANDELLPDAQRLTSFGRWLRSSSIDELPGLLNVLRGEMSFIGPRPLMMQYLPLYSAEQARRHDVKPGFSGWAQINGRNSLSWEEKFRLDVWYVEHHNFFLDLRIFLITILKVIRREGISAAGEATMAPFTGNTADQ